MPMNIPRELVQSIQNGQCVAFVGAGFSGAVVPSWKTLLLSVAGDDERDAFKNVRRLLAPSSPSARDFEAAAQLLLQALGRAEFASRVRQQVTPRADDIMTQRLHHLRGIPFRAILTTNFDPLLDGDVRGPGAYERVLRPRKHRWWDERYWQKGRPGADVVKLHGDIKKEADVVLCTRDYRSMLYSNPAYTTFLRSIFATNTVLYLGFSFTDAYLNELRSEVLALIDHRPQGAPIAYAVMAGVDAALAKYFEAHEGIRVLTYEKSGSGDFSGFDRYLKGIHDETSPVHHLGRLLRGKRILWLDAHPDNNDDGMVFLREATASAEAGCEIMQVEHWRNAIAHLRSGARTDLVITHWGHGDGRVDGTTTSSAAESLLLSMRHDDLFAPVIVFPSESSVKAHRARCLALGAKECVWRWEDLYREIARVFDIEGGAD